MTIDDKAKEYSNYIFNQLDPFFDPAGDADSKDIRHILFKSLKAFYAEVMQDK